MDSQFTLLLKRLKHWTVDSCYWCCLLCSSSAGVGILTDWGFSSFYTFRHFMHLLLLFFSIVPSFFSHYCVLCNKNCVLICIIYGCYK